MLQSVATTTHQPGSDQAAPVSIIALCYLLLRSLRLDPACLWPAAYIINLFTGALSVPMATITSITIKRLQQHFQVVLVKRALCVAYDFIAVFSFYIALAPELPQPLALKLILALLVCTKEGQISINLEHTSST